MLFILLPPRGHYVLGRAQKLSSFPCAPFWRTTVRASMPTASVHAALAVR
jgi:hypothetical protein